MAGCSAVRCCGRVGRQEGVGRAAAVFPLGRSVPAAVGGGGW